MVWLCRTEREKVVPEVGDETDLGFGGGDSVERIGERNKAEQ